MTLFTGLTALLPTSAVDVVAIFSEIDDTQGTFFEEAQEFVFGTQQNQLIADARPIKASINESADFFQHPLENSKNIVDHRIILPVEIELTMVLSSAEFPDVYQQIKQLFLEATPLFIQTKTDTYANQVVQAMPHEESPEIHDGVLLTFRTKETQFAESIIVFSPADETQTDTVDRGEQLPTEASAGTSSLAFDLFQNVSEFFE